MGRFHAQITMGFWGKAVIYSGKEHRHGVCTCGVGVMTCVPPQIPICQKPGMWLVWNVDVGRSGWTYVLAS